MNRWERMRIAKARAKKDLYKREGKVYNGPPVFPEDPTMQRQYEKSYESYRGMYWQMESREQELEDAYPVSKFRQNQSS